MTAPRFDPSGVTVILSRNWTGRALSDAAVRREFEAYVAGRDRRNPDAPKWWIVEDRERIAIVEAARNAKPEGAFQEGPGGD